MRKGLSAALLLALLAAAASAAPVERVPDLSAPAPLQQLGRALAPALPLNALPPAEAAKLSILVERAAAINASATPAAEAVLGGGRREAPPLGVLASARAALAPFSEQDLRALPPERLSELASSILDGARSPAATESFGAPPASQGDELSQTRPLVELLDDREGVARLLRDLLGPERASGVDAAAFAALARRVYTLPAADAQALSLAELRAQAETRARTAALRLAIKADDAARRQGAGERRGALRASSWALLVSLGRTPEPLPGRPDGAALAALDGLIAASGTADRAALSKRARHDLRAIGREAAAVRAELAQVYALSQLPLLTAEGLVRTRLFGPRAEGLEASEVQAGFAIEPGGEPVADVAVVGAGPGGLSLALHAADAGLKTVVFEAGYAAQSFSDAAMKPVYRMRTPAARNSLAQTPFSPQRLQDEVGMTRWLSRYREKGQAADTALYERTRAPPAFSERETLGGEDAAVPSARNELLQHYAHVAQAVERKGGRVFERAPIAAARWRPEDKLWELRTDSGRVQLARNLVLAQGQVGSDGEFARFPEELERAATAMGHLTLHDRRDLVVKNSALAPVLAELRRGAWPGRQLVLHDSLLGTPEIERSIQWLPDGARVAVVGSGESAVKAAVAVLRLKPTAHVTLLVKSKLQAAQMQIPSHQAAPDYIDRALSDKSAAERSVAEWSAFGSPVTPATLADVEAARAAGRLSIVELGEKAAFAIASDAPKDGVIVLKRLGRRGTQLLRLSAGRTEELDVIDGPIISAVGYDRRALRAAGLARQLIERGHLKLSGKPGKLSENEIELADEDPLSCAGGSHLFVVGAQNYGCSIDSAIPGIVARAARTAQHIAGAPVVPPLEAARAAPPAAGAFWRRALSALRSLLRR